MENPCDQEYIVTAALHRQKIVISNLSVREEGGQVILSFHWIGLRRHRRLGQYFHDETAELGRRLRGLFPRLADLSVTIDATPHGRRWNRLVQFRVAVEELEYMMNLQPVDAERCA
ncbi:MAG: hypothetical protein ABFD69_04955 [Candidatus Sumerlaeia bacterium]